MRVDFDMLGVCARATVPADKPAAAAVTRSPRLEMDIKVSSGSGSDLNLPQL
jgi:hypothetical protein